MPPRLVLKAIRLTHPLPLLIRPPGMTQATPITLFAPDGMASKFCVDGMDGIQVWRVCSACALALPLASGSALLALPHPLYWRCHLPCSSDRKEEDTVTEEYWCACDVLGGNGDYCAQW